MGMWRDLHDVVEMVSEGGLQVVTLIVDLEGDTAVPTPYTPYQGKIYDRRGIRTTIQFDSDYVTVMSPEVLAMPELWQRHTAVLRAKLTVLQRMRFWGRQSWLLLLLYPLYTFISALMTGDFPEEWLSLTISALSGVMMVLARKWIVRGLRFLLLPPLLWAGRWYVQRRFRQFVSRPGIQGLPLVSE
jgi:hypothetical protein